MNKRCRAWVTAGLVVGCGGMQPPSAPESTPTEAPEEETEIQEQSRFPSDEKQQGAGEPAPASPPGEAPAAAVESEDAWEPVVGADEFTRLLDHHRALSQALEGGAPRCSEAERHRAMVCDLAERICRIAEDLPRSSDAHGRCADGRERCQQANRSYEERCE